MDQNLGKLNVYFNNLLAGYLSKTKKEDSTNYVFEYDLEYLMSKKTSPIAFSLPKIRQYYESVSKLHPFFDNLVSEGWLREKQTDALKIDKINKNNKFEILSNFGHDLIGSVSIERQPNENYYIPQFFYLSNSTSDSENSDSSFSIGSNATISGVQKKVLVKEESMNRYKITKADELSTHIAKLSTTDFPNLIELEYLSTHAMKLLIPKDEVQNVQIKYLYELEEDALIIERFDRYSVNGIVKRQHFEEFNQLLNKHSEGKYDLSYDEMAVFIRGNNSCKKDDILKLFKRILACILIGNTDAHLKNFAMFHNDDGSMSLTPMYDIVAASYYKEFFSFALALNGNRNLNINRIKAKTIVDFALNSNGFNIEESTLIDVIDELEINKTKAVEFLRLQKLDENVQKKLVEIIEKRWNGVFSGIKGCLRKRKH